MSDVTVVIVNYKTKNLTLNCLNSLFEKTKGISFDVIVVDNNSQDGSIEAIKNFLPPSSANNFKVVGNSENLGFGRANNVALRMVDTKYVFLLNSDTLFVNDAISILYNYMESNPQVGACGGLLLDENNNKTNSYGKILTLSEKVYSTIFSKDKVLGEDCFRGYDDCETAHEVDCIIGADLMIRKDVLDEVGLFDDDFFLYFEETELQFRIRKNNHKIYFVPNSKIIHLGSKSFDNKRKKREEFFKGEYLFYKKCYNLPKICLFKLFYISTLFLRFFVTPKMVLRIIKYILPL